MPSIQQGDVVQIQESYLNAAYTLGKYYYVIDTDVHNSCFDVINDNGNKACELNSRFKAVELEANVFPLVGDTIVITSPFYSKGEVYLQGMITVITQENFSYLLNKTAYYKRVVPESVIGFSSLVPEPDLPWDTTEPTIPTIPTIPAVTIVPVKPKRAKRTISKAELTYREFSIKKKNGKERKICAPSKKLLIYQRSMLKSMLGKYRVLTNNTIIHNTAHGFIKGRNCVTAAKQHIGFDYTIIMDLSNFFDSCTKEMVQKVEPSLSNEYLYHSDGYCAQGFATSPMAANIAVIPALYEVQEYLNEYYKGAVFTIYADDLAISYYKSTDAKDYTAENSIISTVSAVLARHNFKVNTAKTRIRYAKHGFRRLLGINIGSDSIRATRKTMRKIRAAKHQGNSSSLGGLVTWSKCIEPRKIKKVKVEG